MNARKFGALFASAYLISIIVIVGGYCSNEVNIDPYTVAFAIATIIFSATAAIFLFVANPWETKFGVILLFLCSLSFTISLTTSLMIFGSHCIHYTCFKTDTASYVLVLIFLTMLYSALAGAIIYLPFSYCRSNLPVTPVIREISEISQTSQTYRMPSVSVSVSIESTQVL